MRVLLVGAGGREHALAWKLARSRVLDELHAAPGNPGIASLGECHAVAVDDVHGLAALARRLAPDLVVVGPEAPLVGGVADAVAGIPVFGPSAAAARIEGSKRFAKDVMRAARVATARLLADPQPPCVVKADGLAAGKGVFVCETQAELDAAFAAAPRDAFAEELLEGEELSVFALVARNDVVPLAPARDYKRVGDGDTGPNTGGMGAFSPVPGLGHELEDLADAIHRPVAAELAQRGTPFVGLLYAGVMLTADGPRVLEFNCRFGDPETQALLPRLEDDLLEALAAAARHELGGVELAESNVAAVTIVLAAGSYPERGDTGTSIDGIAEAEAAGALVFHAGTAERDGRLITNGGRILNVTAVGDTLEDARDGAYAAAGRIHFDGMRYRRDIALGAVGVVH
ncbi:MAG: phosphoribosylamine--glycine ligase [Thermoleophilia bacterium]|nr:phosphoribosylamine--glycine ligase [Thermoleophilia bacterium]